jgi:hypothetical protein
MAAAAIFAGLTLACVGCHSPAKPPPSPYPEINSEKSLIKNLEIAYRLRDYPKFTTLFADQDSVSYLFLLSEPPVTGETFWGAAEEKRIHRRMFQPQNPLPNEVPVPDDLWLTSVDIVLTPQTEFAERPDFYRSASNPGGLNPARWRATEATYGAYVFFQLAGTTDYQVDCLAKFVVLEDKTKPRMNSPGRWLIYRWEDLSRPLDLGSGVARVAGAGALGVEQRHWSALKRLYR